MISLVSFLVAFAIIITWPLYSLQIHLSHCLFFSFCLCVRVVRNFHGVLEYVVCQLGYYPCRISFLPVGYVSIFFSLDPRILLQYHQGGAISTLGHSCIQSVKHVPTSLRKLGLWLGLPKHNQRLAAK
ncbi:hypothetical protein BC835DRAFT_68833 [Cytidiella melzeri]|nr:hypothetical protein BC835DRAFT_68833 [Cytidiella melzeri]